MIGREKQQEELKEVFASRTAELVAVYGRRRIGKTYLVRQTFGDKFFFQHTGLAKGTMSEQLAAFRDSLIAAGAKDVKALKNWREAFMALRAVIEANGMRRKVLFIDELPWMDTPKSSFVTWFEHFWNGWASGRADIVLIICGSASSWIVKNVFKNRGGLHNRTTSQIYLEPFTLKECQLLCRSKGLALTRQDIAELYMVFGGVPYYWSLLRRGESVAQNIDRLIFASDGKLRHEFRELYASLFGENVAYVELVKALMRAKSGMPACELMKAAGIAKGGNANRYLEDLEQCGFIRKYTAYGKKKRDSQFQLIDNFTLFHLKFLEGESNPDPHFWELSTMAPTLNAWRGLAFERLCLQHIAQIKVKLGISGVLTKVYSWRHVPDETFTKGAQIDLLIERADRVINVCEMKYSIKPFVITKAYDEDLRFKIGTFLAMSGGRAAVHLTMVTSYGLVRNAYANAVQSEVRLEDLFE